MREDDTLAEVQATKVLQQQVPRGLDTESVVAVFPSRPRDHYLHMPSVATWMHRYAGGRQNPGGNSGGRLQMPWESEGAKTVEDEAEARVERLIAAASQKASPAFNELMSSFALPPAIQAAVRFNPSVGTWLQQRPLSLARGLEMDPAERLSTAGSGKLQLKDAKADTKHMMEPVRQSSAADDKEERLDLHFFHLTLNKVNPDIFKKELLAAFLGIGFPKDMLSSLAINLRAGSVIAEIRGPAQSMQKLKTLPIYSIKVMGCQAQSAASAASSAAMAVNAGVMPARLPSPRGPSEATQKPESPHTAVTSAVTSSPAQLPLLVEHSTRGTSAESRTPLLSGTPNRDGFSASPGRSRQPGFKRHAAPPTERRKVGPQRLRARDRWNVEELRISDILSRAASWAGASIELEESDLSEMLAELYGEELELDALPWTFRLASRGGSKCTNMSDLHYAFRAHYICRFLPQATMRTLATTNVSSKGTADAMLVQKLLEELNDGYTVTAAEVNSVLDEATALVNARSGSGRASLVRSISAWYLNVARADSPWSITFKACYGRWIPESGYHAEVLSRLRTSLKAAEEAFHEDVGQAVWGLIQAAFFLSALVFPTLFFLWLVVLGAEHGDDRCPKDLDGLITWYGVLGLALIAVGFVDGNPAVQDEPLVKTSHIGLALTIVLLIIPWIGAFWTFHLGSTDQQTCGLFLTGASSLLWTVCLVSELVLGFGFLWHLAVYQEHELTLQQANQPEAHPPVYGNRHDARLVNRGGEP